MEVTLEGSSLSGLAMTGIAIGRLLAGATFLLAGMAKLHAGRDRTLRSILAYDILPAWTATLFTAWLPWVEVVIGSMLILGFLNPLPEVVGILLVGVFTVALILALRRDKQIECGCFHLGERVRLQLVWRNLGLLILLILALSYAGGSFTVDAVLGF